MQVILCILFCLFSIDPWFPDEINDGHAEYLYYLLSALMGLFFLLYLMVAKMYKYRTVSQDSEEDIVEPDARDGEQENEHLHQDQDKEATGF